VHQQEGRVLLCVLPSLLQHPSTDKQHLQSAAKKIPPLRGLKGIALDFRNVVDAFSFSIYSSNCLISAVIPRPAVPFSQPLQGWQSWSNRTSKELQQRPREGSRSSNAWCLVAGLSWGTPSPWKVVLLSYTAPFLSLAYLILTVPAVTSFTGYRQRTAGPASMDNHFPSASFAAWRLSSFCDDSCTPFPQIFCLPFWFASSLSTALGRQSGRD